MKAIILNKNNEILLLKEARYKDKKSGFYREDGGMYDLPGGWLDWGEDFRTGLMREVKEEMWISYENFLVADSPLYIQLTELDDRYHKDENEDDFYPVLMMYYPVKILDLHFGTSDECIDIIWLPIEKFGEKQIWSHSASLAQIFQKEDFPKSLITSQE